MMKRPYHIGIIGAGACDETTYQLARNVGLEIGKRGWVLICGGLGGVMEGASKGCSDSSGLTVGILPGLNRESANAYIHVPIATGLEEGRNLLVIRASDILISIAGGYGTLSEIALALKTGKKVVGLLTWKDIPGVHYASDYHDAVRKVERFLENR